MQLLVLQSPEAVFWLTDSMLFKLPDYYTANMKGLKVDIMVLTELIRLVPSIVHLHVNFDVSRPLKVYPIL